MPILFAAAVGCVALAFVLGPALRLFVPALARRA
jgi:hypothetical protein